MPVDFHQFSGWTLFSTTTDASTLAGTVLTNADYDQDLYYANDLANENSNRLYDEDDLTDSAAPDVTTSQAGEGIAYSDGGTVVIVEQLGRFDGSTISLDGGGTYSVDMFSYRLDDGTVIFRIKDSDLASFEAAGHSFNDIASITLSSTYLNKFVQNSDNFNDEFTTICIASGTRIATRFGERLIEDLTVGDDVLCNGGEYRKIRWIKGRRASQDLLKVNPKLVPVRIVAGALGAGLPKRDLVVSRQHRILVTSPVAKRMFGVESVLLSAVRLTILPGIFLDKSIKEVEYFHFLFDKHEIIYAEGTPTESLFTGPEALRAVLPEEKDEILSLFPELGEADFLPKPAKLIPTNKLQKKLASRLSKNGLSAIDDRVFVATLC